ncbi:MAG TPA: polysaccharide deacetylase family protein [Bryobacteraceae bacterium]|nr:polysaccharide deacetylase family protein [Bryobacteraceae bacterium]
MNSPVLHIVVYHYVRDLPRSRFPQIKGMLTCDFRRQVDLLAANFEMASLDSAVAFAAGEYQPSRDLCLLTFDDGLKEHYTEATSFLAERRIQGVFFLITGCLSDHRVAPVHMNHFLTAALGFQEYQAAFFRQIGASQAAVDKATAHRTYPWDTAEVAQFKYLFNFVLAPSERDTVVQALFQKYLGDEKSFSRELYLNWEEARDMQARGMALGGHTHEHRPLSRLSHAELAEDLSTCRRLLDANLRPAHWPFCYPYGKSDSFNQESVDVLRKIGFRCAFTTETGPNKPGVDLYRVTRVDCKNAPSCTQGASAA